MMVIAGLTTALGIGAVLVAIGYRLFNAEGSVSASEVTVSLPAGARILSTVVAADRLVVTIEAASGAEIHTFDARSLKPMGRLKLSNGL